MLTTLGAGKIARGGGPSSLLTSLIAYWSLEEASGTRVDATGRGNDLTDNNTVTQTTGKVANCALFTRANSEYLSHTDNADLSMGDIDFTIAAWVFITTSVADTGLVSKFNTGGNQREYLFCTDDPGSGQRFTFHVSSNGTLDNKVNANSLGLPSLSTWYFVVCWHDSVANTINIQVNNGTVDSVAHSTGVFNGTALFSLSAINAGSLWFHDGRMDEVGIWKRVLTSAERTSLYNGGSGVTYPFTGT